MALVKEHMLMVEIDKKREEIREGVKGWLLGESACDNKYCLEEYSCTWDDNKYSCSYLNKMGDSLLRYLHSQGVVIKAEGELPKNPNKATLIDIDKNPEKTWDVAHSFGWRDGWWEGRDDMLKARYTLTKSLIEED